MDGRVISWKNVYIEIIGLPLQCIAITSKRYGVEGVFGGIVGEIFMILPSGVYSFTISQGPASAAALNISEIRKCVKI